MKEMSAQTLLLFLYSSLFLALCVAKPYCPPSSCGIIPNITSPFRLKTDPSNCGDRRAELVCENNVTFLYLDSHKSYVKAINYSTNPTIRLGDASINNHTCSFPTTSTYHYHFTIDRSAYLLEHSPQPIHLMSCPRPLKNHSLYIDVTRCHPSNSRFTYIKVGPMKASEVKHMCRVDVIVWTSWEFKDLNNVSLEEINRSLLYGLELASCPECVTSRTLWDGAKSFILGDRGWLLLIPLGIVVFISAGVSLPLILIIGFTSGLILLFVPLDGILAIRTSDVKWEHNSYSSYTESFVFTSTEASQVSSLLS